MPLIIILLLGVIDLKGLSNEPPWTRKSQQGWHQMLKSMNAHYHSTIK